MASATRSCLRQVPLSQHANSSSWPVCRSCRAPWPRNSGFSADACWRSLLIRFPCVADGALILRGISYTGFTSPVIRWNYLTTPFLFTAPGFEVKEIDPHQENGETWRCLHVRFPHASNADICSI